MSLLRPDWSAVHSILFQKIAGATQLVLSFVWSQAHTIPHTFIGDGRALDIRFDTQQREPGLVFFSIVGTLERAGLQQMRLIFSRLVVCSPRFVGRLGSGDTGPVLLVGQHLVELKTRLAAVYALVRRPGGGGVPARSR